MRNTNHIIALCIFASSIFTLTSCKKEKPTDPVQEKIDQILPKEFSDQLAKQGFKFNSGATPPSLNNIYQYTPVNDYDNSGVFQTGQTALPVKVKVANQNETNADVSFRQAYYMNVDTSAATIISGSGNNFTIYAQCVGYQPNKIVYDYVLTGTLVQGGIQNLTYAFVMVSNPSSPIIAKEGTIRIFHSSENPAPVTSVLRTLQQNTSNELPVIAR